MKKGNIVSVLLGAAMLVAMSSASAKIAIKMQSTGESTGDVCANVAGNWSGTGEAKVDGLTCKYSGTGTVTGSSDLTMNMSLTKTGGSILCPKAVDNLTLSGTCSNGTISLEIPGVDTSITGTTDGNTASLSGDISAPGINAHVDVDLTKTS